MAAGFLIAYDPAHRSELRPNSFAEKRDGHSLWNVRVFPQMGSVVAVIMYPSQLSTWERSWYYHHYHHHHHLALTNPCSPSKAWFKHYVLRKALPEP